MEPTDKELLEKALVDAGRLVIHEALHREFSGRISTEMLDIAVKEMIVIRSRLFDIEKAHALVNTQDSRNDLKVYINV
jgi:hypothetical protein